MLCHYLKLFSGMFCPVGYRFAKTPTTPHSLVGRIGIGISLAVSRPGGEEGVHGGPQPPAQPFPGDTAEIRCFLPCGHFDFESAVTPQNDDFKVGFDSSYSRQNLAKKLT